MSKNATGPQVDQNREDEDGRISQAQSDVQSKDTKSLTTHWHIKTTHMSGTPEYPKPGSAHIYLTACALELDSRDQKAGEYKLTQFERQIETVSCDECRAWAEKYYKHRIYLPVEQGR